MTVRARCNGNLNKIKSLFEKNNGFYKITSWNNIVS